MRMQAVGDAGIAFYFLFGVVYAFTYTPLRESLSSVIAEDRC